MNDKADAHLTRTRCNAELDRAVRQALRLATVRTAGVGLLATGLATASAPALANEWPADIELSNLGNAGFLINGNQPGDFAARAVSGAGDINADGLDDLIIGGRSANGSADTYVVFGTAAGVGPALELSSIANGDGSAGFVLLSSDTDDLAGRAVAAAGDINSDGVDDFIVGASGADPDGREDAGRAYVLFGTDAGFPASLSFDDIEAGDGSMGFVINGVAAGDQAGESVAGIGDVNADGIDDVLLGAPFAADANGDNTGAAYIVYGRSDGFPANIELSALGTGGSTLIGVQAGSEAGGAVAGVGDINGDDRPDLAIGATDADPDGRNNAGQCYIVFGRDDDFPAAVELDSLGSGAEGFAINGVDFFDRACNAVAAAGDLNGDGVGDLVVGAPGAYSYYGYDLAVGESYVIFGRGSAASESFPAELELDDLGPANGGDGSAGFIITGGREYSGSGAAVSGPGDINGDGLDDLFIGAPTETVDSVEAVGAIYVVFGRQTGFAAEFSVFQGDSIIRGIAEVDLAGLSVGAAGDFDGDGFRDVVIGGGGYASPGGRANAGQGYLLYGRAPDSDSDGVSDTADNCLLVSDAGQRDSNGDGIGNACDADLDGSCTVNFVDLGLLKSVFFTADADADFDSSGSVNFVDLAIMKQSFFGPPGPSGLPNDCSGGDEGQ